MLILGFLCVSTAADEASDKKPEFRVILGDWVRTDGGYLLKVTGIKKDGKVEAGYFNPKPINVAEAKVSLWKGYVKLFIKLQDRGYPGSTYTLYYYKEKDALAGLYFQAHLKQTFEVVFIRKKKE